MKYDISLQDNWKPFNEIDLKQTGHYLVRYNGAITRDVFNILVVLSDSWLNGIVMLNNTRVGLNKPFADAVMFVGPIKL